MSDRADTQHQLTCAIRVDASAEMGIGHLRRCIALADQLGQYGIQSWFLCRQLPEELVGLLRKSNHELVLLPPGSNGLRPEDYPRHARWLRASQAEDAEQTRKALEGRRADWLIVDHYALDERWERVLRPCVGRLMVIDDLADRGHDCDLLLDQNYYRDLHQRYRARVNRDCRQLLGPRYALIRPEFLRARSRGRVRSGEIARVLIFFGGVDAGNFTQLALEAVDDLGRSELHVDVLTGAMNPNNRTLAQLCERRPNTRLLTEVEQVAELMMQADVAVGAGGIATWERCCLGLPTLMLVTADNQRSLTRDLCDAGYALCTSAEGGEKAGRELRALLAATLGSSSLVRALSVRCAELVDGRGVQRVAAVIRAAGLTIRPAIESDCGRVYEWRNHPAVRSHSRNAQPLAPERHASWFAATLRDPTRALLVAEVDGLPIGVVRFDVSKDSGEVSIFLAPAQHDGGWGGEVLRRAEEWFHVRYPQVGRLVAEVLPGNPASLAMFKQAGYLESKTVLVKCLAAS